MNSILRSVTQSQTLKIEFLVSLTLFAILLFLTLKNKKNKFNIYNPIPPAPFKQKVISFLPYITSVFAVTTILFALSMFMLTPKVTYPSDPALSTFILTPSNPLMVKIDRSVDKKT